MKTSQKKLFRRFLAATLLIGGPFQLAAPLLAQTAPRPTTANTTISNTATATYDDADANTPLFNATSNTVTITVAEVAGITITGAGAVDADGGSLQPNDVINFDYTLTNVGYDATRFAIPNTASVTGPGTVTSVQYTLDGTNYIPVPANFITGSVIGGGTFQVQGKRI
ncbi:MAG: hypothetical protein KME05_11000 [Gloeocapsa sp. UFS-A4-WI-NPMV-4B04]|jgi:hypothetical protein|nr:hypothetical protein [Gloeocapsa sp. UFS-A4-WI-NPMV-4B04]